MLALFALWYLKRPQPQKKNRIEEVEASTVSATQELKLESIPQPTTITSKETVEVKKRSAEVISEIRDMIPTPLILWPRDFCPISRL